MSEQVDTVGEIDSMRRLTAAQAGQALSTDDVIVLLVPLFEQVAELHAAGRVAALEPDAIRVDVAGGLCLSNPDGELPKLDIEVVHRIQPQTTSGLSIVGTLQSQHHDDGLRQVTDLDLQLDPTAPITRPVYLPGPLSWEKLLGHHDEITDVFQLGFVLASLACGLDFADESDLQSFVLHRKNLFALNSRLHPILASVIVEMTALNRHDRATDVAAMATRLRTWRDQPVGLDVDRALAGQTGVVPRRKAVLSHLRDRLFDLTRRNRLLYYRATAGTVNLTVASVPLMLQIDRIQPEQICTWGGPFASDVIGGKAVPLQQWLRFEDQPYLPGALDQLIAATRRDRAEFGFSNLRLVIAFLRWHNLKEAPDERITTPLLLLPVELAKRKGVRDQYTLQSPGAEAEVNPVLRHQLSQLYDIRLPETVDLNKTSLADLHSSILMQIRQSEPSVELRVVDKVAIKFIRQKALQRLQKYQQRRPNLGLLRSPAKGWLPPYSYAREDYRPLGRALLEHWVRPAEMPQRFEAGAAPSGTARQPFMSEIADAGERLGYELQESDGHRYAWDIDLTQVTLADFNYRKMSLVRDYAQLMDGATDNPSFDKIFSIAPRELPSESAAPLALDEQWGVVASDATQNAAVGLARTKRSFIIQGPPGTGKSQTITNLIADYAAQGKRVLFVCEKRAALDVVFHRLKQSGLDSLCCLIHDSQTDKKAFIADLKQCYEGWVSQPTDVDDLRAKRQTLVGQIAKPLRRVEAFEEAMSAERESLNGSVRGILRRAAALRDAPEIGEASRERLPTLSAWDRHRDLTERLHRFLKERFGIESVAAHVFGKLAASVVMDDQAFSRAQAFCADCQAMLDTLPAHLGNAPSLLSLDSTLGAACAISADSQWLLETGIASHLGLLDTASPAHLELQRFKADHASRSQALASAREASANWRDKLSPGDTVSALDVVKSCEGSLMRWIRPGWWRVTKEIKRRYYFASHAIKPTYTKVLESLHAEHLAAAAMAQVESSIRSHYGVHDVGQFMDALPALKARLQSSDGPRELVEHLTAAADPAASANSFASARSLLDQLNAHASAALRRVSGMRLRDLSSCVRELSDALPHLPDALPLLRAIHSSDPRYADTLLNVDLSPSQVEAVVLDEGLRRLARENPVLQHFGGAALVQSVREIGEVKSQLHQINAKAIRSTWHARFVDHVMRSSQSTAQLDSNGRQFKKNYAAGRRELEHEFAKSMRHRSIRDLSDDETGLVINDLKPIWLMSPLSVSDTLPLSPDLFDVVVFDEASQIPTEEAVPALSRAPQIVIVGDEMQLPPTSFFSATSEGEDEEIVVEEGGERIAINLESDSLLNQAARSLPATLLAWHYRSRHESLISFSNAAFYEGRLVTIPDRHLEHHETEPPSVSSLAEDAGIVGASRLLERPISFHMIEDGVYSERRNVPEANYIARMVRELLIRDTGLSIGVVAFSEAQQAAIESALEGLSAEDQEFSARLEREYVREDNDQFNGLFVKNLENVQGDERDVIILSICYGPGRDGKMLMNFGPINQRGGEKRLNVIFSRARHRMAVVSTIPPIAITNTHNDGAAALRSFLQFAQFASAGQFELAQQVLGGLNVGARRAFAKAPHADAVRDAIATSLSRRGHVVRLNVGRSQFRCDIAIVDSDGTSYAMGILLDRPDEPHLDSWERYSFLPGVLKDFGWKILDVPSLDWYRDPDSVIKRVEAMLGGGLDPALDAEVPLADTYSVPESSPPESNSRNSTVLTFRLN